jgi:uncharacterized membrane protein
VLGEPDRAEEGGVEHDPHVPDGSEVAEIGPGCPAFMRLGANVHDLRNAAGLTLDSLAEAASGPDRRLEHSWVWQLETGRSQTEEIADAEADFEAVDDLHAGGLVGTFDAAVIEKEEGKVHVHKTEKPTQYGTWTGIAVGAVAGILFPPSIIGSAAGGVIGHLWKGMSRGDLKDLGEGLDEGAAALIVIGESRVGDQIEKATKGARKVIEKQIDAEADELKRELEAAGRDGAN